jgi:ABC-type lipoprotein release transport system permease subunit
VMVVTDKRGDIAILKTQGLTPSHITIVFIHADLKNTADGKAA